MLNAIGMLQKSAFS